MTSEHDHIVKAVKSGLTDNGANLPEDLPPRLGELLDDLREKELAANKEKTEESAPRPIATDDAPGG